MFFATLNFHVSRTGISVLAHNFGDQRNIMEFK